MVIVSNTNNLTLLVDVPENRAYFFRLEDFDQTFIGLPKHFKNTDE